MKRLIWLTLAALCLTVPAIASAADGYVTGNVSMRAGPDIGYPLVVTLPAGTPVAIQGCTTDWAWCDVIAYDSRGWVAGNFIQYDYDGQPVLLPGYGARIGIPIVTFVISSYWDTYYRNRPFYRQRATWYRRPMPHRPPPRPIGNPPRPVHPAPARPTPRPPVNHAPARPTPRPPQNGRPVRPPQNAQPARPPQNTRPAARPPQNARPARPAQGQPGKPAANGRPAARPAPPHSSGPAKGKPAPKKKTDDQQH